MPRTTLLIVRMIVVTACSTSSGREAPTPTGGQGGDPGAQVMAAALHELVTVDTTFGKGHRFTTLIVQDSLDPAAGSGHASGAVRALTEGERFAIEARLATVGPVQWTDNPDDWRTPDLVAVVEGSAIIGVGEPVFDDEGALVPVSLWCGGVCGTWFSYRAIETDSGWEAVGPEGPVAVS